MSFLSLQVKRVKPGMDRSDLFNVNAGIVKTWYSKLRKLCPKACIGIITNPVNTTVAIAAEVLKKAGVYDKTTVRRYHAGYHSFQHFFAELKGKQPGEVEAPVIGGHSGVTILPLPQVPGVSFTEQEVADLTKRIQNAGTEVVEAKAGGGSATLVYGPSSCTFWSVSGSCTAGRTRRCRMLYVEGDGQYARFFSTAAAG